MKKPTIYLITCLFLGASLVFAQNNGQIKVPTSNRSVAISSKLSPMLQNQLEVQGFTLGNDVYIQSFKEELIMEVWIKKSGKFQLFKSYPICTYGEMGLGPKRKEGDQMAPEGFYQITPKSLNPYSSYHLSMNLGYPNQFDRFHNRTGNYLMIHGECVSIGCYAMTNQRIEEIYLIVQAAILNGQEVVQAHLFPFKMTPKNMSRHQNSKNYSFWENLKQGYDWFYQKGEIPPKVSINQGLYVFKNAY